MLQITMTKDILKCATASPHLLDGLDPLPADGVPDADCPVRAVPGDGLAVDHGAVVAAVLPSSHPRLNSDAENW